MTDIEIKRFAQGVEYGMKRGLEAAGKKQLAITVAELKRIYNPRAVTRAIQNGTLKPVKKGGRTASQVVTWKDVDMWLLINEIAE